MNSGLRFDFLYSLAPSIRFERDLFLKEKDLKLLFVKFKRKERKIRLAWQCEVPIITLASRPNYAGVINGVDGNLEIAFLAQHFENLRIVSFNKFLMLSSRLEMFYHLKNNCNMIKLSYQWQGLSYQERIFKLQDVFSYFSLSYIFKFDKNPNY